MSETPSLPRCTVSVSLFFQTFVVLALMSTAYFLLYMPASPSAGKKIKEIYVHAGDNLEQIVKNQQEPLCLLLSPALRKCDLRLTGKSNLILKGNGKAGEVILEGIADAPLIIEDCTAIRLENITLRNASDRYPALRISHGNKIEIIAVRLESPAVAMHIYAQSYDITIERSQLAGKLEVADSRRISLAGNHIAAENSAITDPVVQLNKTIQVSLDNNEIKGITGIALVEVASEKGYQNCIYKNSIAAVKHSVSLENCSDFLFSLNTIETETGPAMSLRKCTNMQVGKQELRNTIKTATGKVLDMSGCNDIEVSDNWLSNRDGETDNRQPAYAMEIQSCRHVDVLRNEISGFARYEEATQVMQDVKGGGVHVSNSTEIVLDNNHIFRGMYKGVYVRKLSEVVAKGNRIEENAESGIEIENSKFIIGPDNAIARNLTGILIRDSEGSVLENQVGKNQREGIIYENCAARTVKNKIFENGSDGLSLKRNSMPELEQNEFTKNQGHGIAFWQIKVVNWKNNNIFRDNLKGDSNK